VKLSAAEIVQLQQALDDEAHGKVGVQAAFRRLILSRAQSYLADGYGAAPPYDDNRSPVDA
jgi:hypothetical protein